VEAPTAKKVFISYAHADEEYRKALEGHLSGLRRDRLIEVWHDRLLGAGDEIDGSISGHLANSDVVLLLISSDFLASPYCMDVEMEAALRRENQGLTRIIPVIVRPCDWHTSPFGKLLAAPTDGKPISTSADRDEAMLDVARMIRAALARPRATEPAITDAPQVVGQVRGSRGAKNESVEALIGRDDELAFASSVLSGLRDDGSSAKFILIGGEAGAGKSSLAAAICEMARDNGYRVFATACEPFHEGMALFPIRELLRQACNGRRPGDVVAELYGAGSVEAGLAQLSMDPSADPETRRDATIGTFANLIYGLGQDRSGVPRPLVINLDDLECVDTGTADALLCLLARRAEGRVAFVGAYRTDLLGDAKTSSKALARLLAAGSRARDGFKHVRLTNIPLDRLPDLVSSVLQGPNEFTPRFFERLHRETEGNPLFVREVLHTLAAEISGEPATIAIRDGAWRLLRPRAEWRIPASIEAAIQCRFEMLDPDQRTELERAAVIGPRFSFEMIRQLSDMPAAPLLSTLEKLISFDLIREVQAGGDAFAFSHGKIREVLYGSMSRSRRRLMHEAVADWMLACEVLIADNWNAMIADHLYAAGRHREACPLLLTAARDAMSAFSPMEAVGLFRKAEEAGRVGGFPAGEAQLRVALEEAEALKQAHDYSAALERGEWLISAPGGDVETQGWAYDLVGDVLMILGRIDDALNAYEKSEAIGRTLDRGNLLLEAVADVAELSCREFEHAAGIDADRAAAMKRRFEKYLDEEVRLAAESPDRPARARALRNAAKRLRMQGDLEGAIRTYEQALAYEPPGSSPHRVLISYAKTLRLAGRPQQAAQVIDRVLDWARQVGAVRSEAIARQHKGIALLLGAASSLDRRQPDQSLLAAAKVELNEALRLHEEIGYKNGQRETQMAIGEWHLLAGDCATAKTCFKLCLEDKSEDATLLNAIEKELLACGEPGRAQLVRLYGTAAVGHTPCN